MNSLKRWLKQLWKWLSLDDGAAHPVHGYCDFCSERSAVLVYINDQTWNTCITHMNEPVRQEGRARHDLGT